MRLRNYFDFESDKLTREERLTAIRQATYYARERARTEGERRELEFVYQDCQKALESLKDLASGEEQWLDRRMQRMARVLNHYEDFLIRLNRRYWWIFFAIGLTLMLLFLLFSSPNDVSLWS